MSVILPPLPTSFSPHYVVCKSSVFPLALYRAVCLGSVFPVSLWFLPRSIICCFEALTCFCVFREKVQHCNGRLSLHPSPESCVLLATLLNPNRHQSVCAVCFRCINFFFHHNCSVTFYKLNIGCLQWSRWCLWNLCPCDQKWHYICHPIKGCVSQGLRALNLQCSMCICVNKHLVCANPCQTISHNVD